MLLFVASQVLIRFSEFFRSFWFPKNQHNKTEFVATLCLFSSREFLKFLHLTQASQVSAYRDSLSGFLRDEGDDIDTLIFQGIQASLNHLF